MRVANIKSFTMKAWEEAFCKIDHRTHWKDGRSAQSLAKFFVERDGVNTIKTIVDSVLSQDKVEELQEGKIECECPFDSFSTPRRQDMGIWGRTIAGKKIFVGIEAKVDESFGPTVGEAFSAAMKYRKLHPKSKREDRIKALCDKFGTAHNAVEDLRYQLFHYTAGTACVPDVDIHVMLTMVFKTRLYVDKKATQNKSDYEKFLGHFFFEDSGRWQLKKCGLPSCPYAIYHSVDLV